jgi:type I restriction enzyme S subunit
VRAGWEETTLGNVVSFKGGGTPSTETASYWNGDIPWVSPKDMKSSEVGDSIDKITTEAIENSAASLIPKNAILIVVRSGILARTIPVALTTRPVAVNQDIKALCAQPDVDPRYLHYFMQMSEPDILKLVTRGATVHRLSTDSLKALKFAKPPLPEQQRIVDILDEAFVGLSTAAANAEKNLKSTRELFDSYLNSVFTQRSDGWTERLLSEVSIEFGRGRSKQRPRNDPSLYGGKYPFIQTGDIRNADHLIVEYSQSYNEKGLAQSKLWPKGTICITIAANIAETGILSFDSCFPDSVIGIVVDPAHANNKFVEYLFHFFKATLQAQGKGSAQHNINLATFENRKFPFPSVEVQGKLIQGLDAMAEQIRRLESYYHVRLQSISELKQSILQKAFAGELTSPPSRTVKEAAE